MARVLLIEDNPANLELMVYLLQAFGHQPLTTSDGRSGLEAARRERPDLILCDIQLPDADGYALARQFRADPALARLPLVAVTAYAMLGDRDRALAAGFNGYVTKPIDPETFVAQIEAFLPPKLPAGAPAAPTQPLAPQPGPQPGTRAQVLIVDDSPAAQGRLAALLQPAGYGLQSSAGVAEALEKIRRAPPDVILCRLDMRPLSGFEMVRAIKSRSGPALIPIILYANVPATPQDRALARALGAALLVEPPIERAAWPRLIEASLRGFDDD